MPTAAELPRFGFDFSEDQVDLYEGVREFARDRLAPGAAARDRTGKWDEELVGEMGAMGLMGIRIPEQYGGADADYTTYALLVEALGESDAAMGVIVSATNLVTNIILKLGSDAQKQKYLPAIADGSLGALAFCLSEPHAGSDAKAMKSTATRTDDGWVLEGGKMWITNGSHAGLFMIFAITDPSAGSKGISAFLVDKGTPGLSIGKEEDKMGQRASGTVAIFMSDLHLPHDALIGEEGLGYRSALTALTAGRVGISGLSIGISEAALSEGITYATERMAFGTRIADFQNTQFVLADCRTRLDAAWLLTLRAAKAVDRGEQGRMETSMAKVFATETADDIVDKMLQIHGGYGYSREYTIERLYRDNRVTRIYEGSSEVQRLVIARQMLAGL